MFQIFLRIIDFLTAKLSRKLRRLHIAALCFAISKELPFLKLKGCGVV